MPDRHETLFELCAGYVLGALRAEDRSHLEAHLLAGCERCDTELNRLREATVAIATSLSPTPTMPSHSLRERILERIAHESFSESLPTASTGEPADGPDCDCAKRASTSTPGRKNRVWDDWQGDDSTDGMFFLHANQGGWQPTGTDGIEVRRLFVDPEANRMTAMFRMAAGTAYFPHEHDGYEECYVLSGDLRVGDIVMRAGDYQRAEAGSTHGVQSTEQGCVLLISSSLSDEGI